MESKVSPPTFKEIMGLGAKEREILIEGLLSPMMIYNLVPGGFSTTPGSVNYI